MRLGATPLAWLLAAFLSAFAAPLAAQDTTRVVVDTTTRYKSDSLPLKPTRTLSFDTDEATWASLDVSPDGRTLVFELLGDLYTLPMGGGVAKAITTGLPSAARPGELELEIAAPYSNRPWKTSLPIHVAPDTR